MPIPLNILYRPYEEWSQEEKDLIRQHINLSPWRTHYHIEPKTGLLNDPNGFSYFNGSFHLFYQNWPFGAGHGLKSWVHTESQDLVHFQDTGMRLLPDTPHDSHGAYSGSAFPFEDKLFLFYTGNVRVSDWKRQSYQLGAFMDKDNTITKMDSVLITAPNDVTDHFRDPQVFSYQDQLYAIIGAQHVKTLKGFIKLYRAIDNDIHHWEWVGDLEYGSHHTEYMVECPNLLFVEGQPVLLACPQGLSKDDLNYQNIYPNTVQLFQEFDPNTASLKEGSGLMNLDEGFECYATQGFTAPDGRTLIVSWVGLPDISYPSDQYDHQGVMSLVKELTVKDGKLYQYPVESVKTLRRQEQPFTNMETTSNTYELELTFEAGKRHQLVLWADSEGNGLTITVDTNQGKVNVDRTCAGVPFATEYGTIRECDINREEVTLNIFADTSIFEIFVNHGEKVFTGRIFPQEGQNGILITEGTPKGTYYTLKY